jgi:DNA-binding NarL/FixJ family response regulator
MDIATKSARTAIVDDERMVMEALELWLKTKNWCMLVGHAMRAEEGHNLCLAPRPDLVLIDINLPGAGGIELAEPLLAELPHIRVLLFPGCMDPHTIWRVSQSGVQGYVNRTEGLDCLILAIEAILRGEKYFSAAFQEVKSQWLSQPDPFQKVLSAREQGGFERVVCGWTDERIARKLAISAETVAFHRKNIRKKLNLHSDRDMVAYGRIWGFR